MSNLKDLTKNKSEIKKPDVLKVLEDQNHPISVKYRTPGIAEKLGAPKSDIMMCPDKVGSYRHYRYGSIYYHPEFGAFEVHGAIEDRWESLGWETGLLGYPVTDETTTPDGRGRFNHFQHGGSIYWKPGIGAFEVHGAIRTKWSQLQWEQGPLGYPKTNETSGANGGKFNHFENGSIYWYPGKGAFAIQGAIRAKWETTGWENGPLGYPTSNESTTLERNARYQDFQNGIIINHDVLGIFAVHGPIYEYWNEKGLHLSKYGFPMSDVKTLAGGRSYVVFEFGVLMLKSDGVIEEMKPLNIFFNTLANQIQTKMEEILRTNNLSMVKFDNPNGVNFIKTHHNFCYEDKCYHRILEIDLNLKSGSDVSIDIDLFLNFLVTNGALRSTIVKQAGSGVDLPWYVDIATAGQLASALSDLIPKKEGLEIEITNSNVLAVHILDDGGLNVYLNLF